MFRQLKEIGSRPVVFAHYTAPDLWTDNYTSSRMLAYHLNGSIDVSSRKAEFIDRSVHWIVTHFGLDESKSVADFGCGPGLYTTRLAESGVDVTGIDFSEPSIRYARELSERQGLSIDYAHANYLEYETSKRFDLVTMIMCDFCALSPNQRRTMLDKYFSLLKPGGALLLDVYSLCGFDEREESASFAPGLLDGFWSSEPYFGFLNVFKYPQDKVMLDKYTIIEEGRTRVVYNWLQYFDRKSLEKEIRSSGFTVAEFLGDVSGATFDPKSHELAVVARKPASV